MKTDKLKKYETKIEPEISPEMDKRNREIMVALLLPIVEKVKNLPSVSPLPSFAELLDEMRNGVKRQPMIIQTSADSTLLNVSDEKTAVKSSADSTLYDTGGAENSGENKFTDLELELLRQIEK